MSHVVPSTPRRRVRAAWVAAGLLACVVVTAVSHGRPSHQPATPAAPRSLATVTIRDLTQSTAADGTLGYAGRRTIVNRLSGTLTQVRRPGSIVRAGDWLFKIDQRRVTLLYGKVPAFRTLSTVSEAGIDVRQLERNLLRLGFDPDHAMTIDGHFTAATAAAVRRFQKSIGDSETGSLELGTVVFAPGPRRVASLEAAVGTIPAGASAGGTTVSPPTPILVTTTTRRVVSVPLDAAKQSVARVGERVRVTLPTGKTIGGRVNAVARVARTEAGSGGGSGGSGEAKTTIPITVALDHPRSTGSLDEAPVSVVFRTTVRRHVLTVPVTALAAVRGGGFSVVAFEHGRVLRVPVRTGLYANGYVELHGDGLRVGTAVENSQ